MISGADMSEFAAYFATRGGFGGVGANARQVFCNGPLRYIGHAAVQADIEHWMRNRYYPTDEAYLHAIAEAMHEEYKAIVDAGFLLQIDDPDLPDAWQIHPHLSVPEYRKFAALRVEALAAGARLATQQLWGAA